MTLCRTIAAMTVLAALALAPAAQAKGTVFSTGNSNELQSKPIAADGTLGAASTVPTGMVTPRTISITPNGRFLYMSTAGANVLGWDISGATPTQVPGSPYNVTDTFGYSSAITPDGRFLYVGLQNGQNGRIAIFAINGDGSLTKVGANVPVGYDVQGSAISPNGQTYYVIDNTNDTVHSYAIAADGTISEIGTPRPAGTNPKGIAVHPAGSHVFTGATGGQLSSFPVGGDGTLGAASFSVATGLMPQTLAVTQNGQFLYAAHFPSATGRILAYAIGADGSLTAVPGQPFAATANTYGVDAAPGARFVYSTSFDAMNDVPMDGFLVGADGALSQLPGSPFPTAIAGTEFQSVAVTPNQGPTAQFTFESPGAGQPTLFNASGSSDSDGGTIAAYVWDFGDGSTETTTTPTVSHSYAAQGDYQVTLTVVDDEGCSNQQLYTGQTADCNGSGTARLAQTVQVAGGTAPNLKLKGKKQELAKKVTVTAKTTDDTDAVAKGKLKVEKKSGKKQSYTLEKAKKPLDGGEKTKLKPKLSDKAYKKAKKALKQGGKVSAKVNVKVTDADDDTDKDSVKVKLTR
jgi:6-phosphogluconolactonase